MDESARIRNLFESWLSGLSQATQRKYRRALALFRSRFSNHPCDLIETGKAATEQALEEWRDALLASGLAPQSIPGVLSIVAGFVRVARDHGLCDWLVERVMPGSRQTRPCRRQAGANERDAYAVIVCIEREACREPAISTTIAIRDLAMAHLLHAGIGTGRLVALTIGDIADLSVGGVICSRASMVAVRGWMHLRGTTNPTRALFTGVHGADVNPELRGPLSRESVRLRMEKWSRIAGVELPMRPSDVCKVGESMQALGKGAINTDFDTVAAEFGAALDRLMEERSIVRPGSLATIRSLATKLMKLERFHNEAG